MISTETSRNSYTGNGSTTTFAYTFKIFSSTDLKVYVNDVLKTITTHYTLTGVGSGSGGNVIFEAGSIPANGAKIDIVRRVELKQLTDYVSNDIFPAQTHEDTLDKIVQQIQMLKDILSQNSIFDPAGELSRVSVRVGSNQTISNGNTDKITLNSVDYDVLGEFDAVTNYRFTPSVSGGYLVIANVRMDFVADVGAAAAYIKKNGTAFVARNRPAGISTTLSASASLSAIVLLTTSDYIELFVENQTGGEIIIPFVDANMQIKRLW